MPCFFPNSLYLPPLLFCKFSSLVCYYWTTGFHRSLSTVAGTEGLSLLGSFLSFENFFLWFLFSLWTILDALVNTQIVSFLFHYFLFQHFPLLFKIIRSQICLIFFKECSVLLLPPIFSCVLVGFHGGGFFQIAHGPLISLHNLEWGIKYSAVWLFLDQFETLDFTCKNQNETWGMLFRPSKCQYLFPMVFLR